MMTPSKKYAKQLTGEEFIKLIAAPAEDPYVKQYLSDELNSLGGNLRHRVTEDLQSGKPRSRQIYPITFTDTNFRTVNEIGSDADLPVYSIVDPVNLTGVHVDWNISLIKCRFTEPLIVKDCSFMGSISFDKCVFEKGAYFEKIKSDAFRFTEMESLTNVKIVDSDLASFWLSSILLPPTVVNTRVQNFGCWPKISRFQ